jgi:hypothetical protein
MNADDLLAIDIHTHREGYDRMAWPLHEVIAENQL